MLSMRKHGITTTEFFVFMLDEYKQAAESAWYAITATGYVTPPASISP